MKLEKIEKIMKFEKGKKQLVNRIFEVYHEKKWVVLYLVVVGCLYEILCSVGILVSHFNGEH